MSRVILLFLLTFAYTFGAIVEEFPFIGVTVATQTIDLKNDTTQKETTTTIKYGKQTTEMRTVFGYEFSGKYRSFQLEIDKILLDELFGKPEYRPYAGLVVGTLRIDTDTFGTDSGYYYGAALGLILYATDSIDADLSYHYYKTEGMDDSDSIKGAAISLHYFY
jgi:hypothetical protein